MLPMQMRLQLFLDRLPVLSKFEFLPPKKMAVLPLPTNPLSTAHWMMLAVLVAWAHWTPVASHARRYLGWMHGMVGNVAWTHFWCKFGGTRRF